MDSQSKNPVALHSPLRTEQNGLNGVRERKRVEKVANHFVKSAAAARVRSAYVPRGTVMTPPFRFCDERPPPVLNVLYATKTIGQYVLCT